MKEVRISLLILLICFLGSCSKSNIDNEEEKTIIPITFELLKFIYTKDAGNNSNRLEYEIKFLNKNDYTITGYFKIKIDIDGLISSRVVSSTNIDCSKITANSFCVFSVDDVVSNDVGQPKEIKFVSAEYIIK